MRERKRSETPDEQRAECNACAGHGLVCEDRPNGRSHISTCDTCGGHGWVPVVSEETSE